MFRSNDWEFGDFLVRRLNARALVGVLAGPAGGKKLVGHRQQVVQRRGDIFLSATKLFFSVGR